MRIALAALLLATGAAPAPEQSPFDGTWRLDPDAPGQPALFEISLRDGIYACFSCRPAWQVAADGRYHRVAGQDRFDETSIRVVSARMVVFRRRLRGRDVYEATDTLSADGNVLSFTVRESSASGVATTASGLWARVGPPPAAAHLITGTWRESRPDSVSDASLTFTMRIEGDVLHVAGGTGEAYDLRFGGPAVAIRGDASGTRISARRLAGNVIEETDLREGQAVSVRTSTIIDATTMTILVRNLRTGREHRMVARRR